jgi:oligopeptide transport system substrate-binding protein
MFRTKRPLMQLMIATTLATSTTYAALPLAERQVMRIGNGTEPKGLDPAKVTGVPEHHILQNLFEGLTGQDPITLEPTPGAASSWEISTDGKTYTFKIRPEAQWSDGTPLTADDFVASWIRALNPKTASEYAYQLYYIENGEEFNTGKLKDSSKVGVKAKDKNTLVVKLKSPTPFFLRLTSFYTLYPVPLHTIKKYGEETWTHEGKMVSNGPFRLTEWKINKHIKMVRNEKYWDAARVKLTEVAMLPIENIDTENKMFHQGELEITSTVPSLRIPKYTKERASKAVGHPYQSNSYLGTYFYRLNVNKKPLDDRRVRRALALTIDRKLLIDKVTLGGQKPALAFTPPETAGYSFKGTLNEAITPQAIAEAQKLLADAGFPGGKGFPKLDILYNTSEDHKKIAIAIQQMWKKNLGIEVGLYNQEWKVYLTSQTQMNYQISRSAWIGDYPDPNTFLDMWVTGGGNNNTGWSNKEYDRLIDQAALTKDPNARYEIFRQAETLLMTELPIIPIYFYTRNKLQNPKVALLDQNMTAKPWASNILDSMPLKYYVMTK